MTDKYILFSDLHIHNHHNDWNRVDHAIDVLEWIKNEALERGIKEIFFLGDFFHIRGYMYPTIVAKAFQKLLEFKEAGLNLYLLIGNHDMPHKYSTKDNTLTAFNSLFPVIEQPKLYQGENYNFWFLPYIEDEDQLEWAIGELSKRASSTQTNPNSKNVLLAHLDIRNAKLHSNTNSTHGISTHFLQDKFDLVITGHYHINQQPAENIYYIGSPYQQNFGEANQRKGFYVFDNGDLEYIENTFSPKYLTISQDQISNEITGNYVKISVDSHSNIADIKARATQHNPLSLSIRMNPASKDEKNSRAVGETRDIHSLLTEWVKDNANPEIFDLDKLLSLGREIISTKVS